MLLAAGLMVGFVLALAITRGIRAARVLDESEMHYTLFYLTLSDVASSIKRAEVMEAQCRSHGLQCVPVNGFHAAPGTEYPDALNKSETTRFMVKNSFALVLETAATYAKEHPEEDFVLAMEDDVELRADFVPRLKEVVAAAPSDWAAVHLCPGCIWGRGGAKATDYLVTLLGIPRDWFPNAYWKPVGYAQPGEIGDKEALDMTKLNPTGSLFTGGFPWKENHDCPLGGPVAMAVKVAGAEETAMALRKFAPKWHTPIDVVIKNVVKGNAKRHLIIGKPALCVEVPPLFNFAPRFQALFDYGSTTESLSR